MFCKHCGTALEGDEAFCSKCGKSLRVPNQTVHWVPLLLSTVVFFVFFGILGGDYTLSEVNIFDHLALITAVVAIILSIATVPKERMALRVTSIAVSCFAAFSALSWVVSNGF